FRAAAACLLVRQIVYHPIQAVVILFQTVLGRPQMIFPGKETRKLHKPDRIHIMTGYLSASIECYDIADRKAVAPEICRMIKIESHEHLLKQYFSVLEWWKRSQINHIIMVNLRFLSLPL